MSETEELLKRLVALPSLSGEENQISSYLQDHLKERGLRPKVCGQGNVYFSVGKGSRTLLFLSHMDTVPVCPGWKGDPFRPRRSRGRLYGLGANDAKGSLAAMLQALSDLADSSGLGGKLTFAATVQEETRNVGAKELMERLGSVEAVVVGEPTGLNICTSMRGLAIIKLLSSGKSAHASRPSEGINAIYRAMADIARLRELRFPRKHPALDYPSLAVTMIHAGIKTNVIPARCEATLDVRTTPYYDNQKLVDIIKARVRSKVSIVSQRLGPKETPKNARIVRAAKRAHPRSRVSGFRAMCDWALVPAPGIVLGPGRTYDSHVANESIALADVERAKGIYSALAIEYFR